MDLLQRARQLYAAGRIHDALEAAQSACDHAPKNAEAWWLLGSIGRHAGLPAASDAAFRRAAGLGRGRVLPHRVSAEHFRELLGEARERLSPDARRRLAQTALRVEPLPAARLVLAGLDPDALSHRERTPQDVLTLFQVNHENRSHGDAALRALLTRTLSRA